MMSNSNRRTVLSLLGFASTTVVASEAFASSPPEKPNEMRSVHSAVNKETLAAAMEQMAKAIRSDAILMEQIEVNAILSCDDIAGRHTMTLKFIHFPEVKV